MKKIIILGLVFASFGVHGQSPVTWSFEAKKLDAKTYEVHLTAKLNGDWHTYSQSTPDGGPVPTSISFSKNPLLDLDGRTREVGKMEEHFEPLFGVNVKQYSSKVTFVHNYTIVTQPFYCTINCKILFFSLRKRT